MSYYRITVKDNGKDDNGDILFSVTVFKYKDKVRTELQPGTFTSFTSVLSEIVCRSMYSEKYIGKGPIYYYELEVDNAANLADRISNGIDSLLENLPEMLEGIAGGGK